jgi:hypothetical protein
MMQNDDSIVRESDPMVVEAVQAVRDRFGAAGLRSLILLAQNELNRVERAETQLAAFEPEEQVQEPPPLDAADTQAWLAYTEADSDEEGGRRR